MIKFWWTVYFHSEAILLSHCSEWCCCHVSKRFIKTYAVCIGAQWVRLNMCVPQASSKSPHCVFFSICACYGMSQKYHVDLRCVVDCIPLTVEKCTQVRQREREREGEERRHRDREREDGERLTDRKREKNRERWRKI